MWIVHLNFSGCRTGTFPVKGEYYWRTFLEERKIDFELRFFHPKSIKFAHLPCKSIFHVKLLTRYFGIGFHPVRQCLDFLPHGAFDSAPAQLRTCSMGFKSELRDKDITLSNLVQVSENSRCGERSIMLHIELYIEEKKIDSTESCCW